MVHDDRAVGPDGLQVVFDDERVVSDAGVVLVATLAQRLGIGSAETLRKWLRQAETDEGSRAGRTTEESGELRALKRKVSELERTIQILTEATRFFALADGPPRR